ncbi:TetR/AcrR family transcriptional regulator [Rhodococcus wratislaviensis]|uniref:Putative TetR family transcriptional regulator n=1 Tax=Rhodococcus wratislaviensis NBRC 100605 TaxID=1219028 RepID=X0R7R8_RHOWR|nr:TetR/AcrR family transcriptional regulator [Rhodococcus wratislaviensis]GAF46990.1 putative TetR family transcriptional regulator [Rhodococcus wratislaviensis NBRC 100605]
MNHQRGHEPENEQPATSPAPRKRTGGRSARVRQAVLTATLDQVAEHGIEGLTVGDVAARAGVAETTIYRRWGTRTALVADAVTELAAVGNPVPDTGTLRGDLHQLADQIAHLISRPGIARLLATTIALSADPDVAAARRRFWNDRFERTAHVIRKAIERGELPEDVDPREVLETLSAPLYFRLLVGDQPLESAFITRCIDHTIALYTMELRSSHGPEDPLTGRRPG